MPADCPICLEVFKDPIKTKCGHKFCSTCLEKSLYYDPYCPICKKPLRSIVGKQPPNGTMSYQVINSYCAEMHYVCIDFLALCAIVTDITYVIYSWL